MGFVIALVAIAALGFLPVGLRGEYDASGARAWLQIGPLRYFLYPRSQRRRTAGKKKTGSSGNQSTKPSSKGGKMEDFFSISDIIWDFIRELNKKVIVDLLVVKIRLADDDPADLAIKYARMCSLACGILPQLERVCNIKNREIDISFDFNESQSLVIAKLYMSITVGRLIYLAIRHGSKFLKRNYTTKNNKKGGAKA